MTYWFSQFAIFILIWFVVMFTVLPMGVRRNEEPERGHDPGAPTNPQLPRKALITTAIALLIWGAYFVVTQVLGYSVLSLTQFGSQS